MMMALKIKKKFLPIFWRHRLSTYDVRWQSFCDYLCTLRVILTTQLITILKKILNYYYICNSYRKYYMEQWKYYNIYEQIWSRQILSMCYVDHLQERHVVEDPIGKCYLFCMATENLKKKIKEQFWLMLLTSVLYCFDFWSTVIACNLCPKIRPPFAYTGQICTPKLNCS